MKQICMPSLSESMTEGKLLRWCVSRGDTVREGDALAEVETDKANMEIEAPEAGAVMELRGVPGDMIAVGEVMVVLD